VGGVGGVGGFDFMNILIIIIAIISINKAIPILIPKIIFRRHLVMC
jgi:hypothetical protein